MLDAWMWRCKEKRKRERGRVEEGKKGKGKERRKGKIRGKGSGRERGREKRKGKGNGRVICCDHASLWRYEASNVGRTHGRTDAQVILYSVQCYCIALDGQKDHKIKSTE